MQRLSSPSCRDRDRQAAVAARSVSPGLSRGGFLVSSSACDRSANQLSTSRSRSPRASALSARCEINERFQKSPPRRFQISPPRVRSATPERDRALKLGHQLLKISPLRHEQPPLADAYANAVLRDERLDGWTLPVNGCATSPHLRHASASAVCLDSLLHRGQHPVDSGRVDAPREDEFKPDCEESDVCVWSPGSQTGMQGSDLMAAKRTSQISPGRTRLQTSSPSPEKQAEETSKQITGQAAMRVQAAIPVKEDTAASPSPTPEFKPGTLAAYLEEFRQIRSRYLEEAKARISSER